MFRKMRRSKQELTKEECIEILKKEPRGVLSVQGEEGYPYGMPMTHWYNEKDGKIYFHGAKSGHKIDAIRNCDKVSFCVMDKGYRKRIDTPSFESSSPASFSTATEIDTDVAEN